MPRFVDRTGQRFGKLTVLERSGVNNFKKILWLCRCECGKELNVIAGSLVTANTTSCGCFKPNLKHGGWNKSSYNSWRAMMRRCYKLQDKDYRLYGGRGVKVCDQWHDYSNFAKDMGEPIGDETLDRINTYGNYEPANCRWAGVKTQNRNVRIRDNSKTGIIGVGKTLYGKYMAKVTVNKKSFYSKCFSTLEEAAAARKELERLHWEVA